MTGQFISIISTLILLSVCSFEMNAGWYPKVINYPKSSYGSGPQNWTTMQTSNSWVYFGNSYGMLEFDGINWVTYPVPNHTCVRSLLYDNDKIYVGAENEFGYYDTDSTGALSFYSLKHLLGDDRYFGNIWKIHKLDKSLYFQAEKSIFKLNDGAFERIDLPEKIEYSTVVHNVLWVAGATGIYYILGNTPMKLNLPQLAGKQVISILPYKEKHHLFVTSLHGLFVWDGDKIVSMNTGIDGVLNRIQLFTAAANEDYIALGSVQAGLFVLDHSGNLYTQLSMQSGLNNNTILSIFFDSENNVWLGLDDGISYVALNYPVTNLYNKSNYYGKGTASYLKDGIMYLGTNQGLMFKKWPIGVSLNPVELERIPGLSGVWDLTEINGDLFCSYNKGVFLIRGTGGKNIEGTAGTWSCKPMDENKILTGTFIGFQVLEKNGPEWKFAYTIKGFDGPGNNFEFDGKYIWKSDSEKGIARLTLNHKKDSVVSIRYYGINEGLPASSYNGVYRLDGKIVFSTKSGIYSYNEKSDRMEKDTHYDSVLAGKIPYTALKQNKEANSYWFISDWTVGYSKKNKTDSSYQSDLFTGQYFKTLLFGGFEHINPLNDSCTLVGTEDGFAWMDPTRRLEPEVQPHLSIRRIWLRKENDSIIYRDNFRELAYKPEIPYSFNSLRFTFQTTEYYFNPETKYAYKLDNYDRDWSEYSVLTAKEYTKLTEGEYTFHVRAISNYCKEPVYASFSFKILPPWYRSTLAYIVYVLLFLSSCLCFYKYLKYRWKKSKKRLAHKKDLEFKEQTEEFKRREMLREQEILQLKQEQLENELKLKSGELASTLMLVKDKNEIFSDINEGLNTIYGKMNSDDSKKEIRQLQLKINQGKERDDYWKKFEENFDLVHDSFFEKLRRDYPLLTTSDRKLCAFLKMNLSSKEIAQLTNISTRSVELSRYRLRKKLGLSREENLSNWVQNY